MIEHLEQIQTLCRHINNVQANCQLLGERLIKNGDIEIGKQLIAVGFLHDNSKFFGIEFEYLNDDENLEAKKLAIKNHAITNRHHPEFWGGIHHMPKIAIAEMVCDWKARSSEFGSSLMEYITQTAMTRFGFGETDPIYGTILEFVNLLLDKPFTTIVESTE